MQTLGAYRRILGNGNLAALLFGEFVSSIGDWLYLVSLLILVYERSHDPVALGVVGAARIAPYVLLAVPAGAVADRFDRKWILLTTDVVRGVLQLVLAGLVLVSAPTLAVVVVVLASSCMSAFFGPAIAAYLPSLVDDEDDLGVANSMWATLDNLAYFVGPAVAGLLIAAGGLAATFLLNAATFALVALVMLRLPSGRPRPQPAAPAEPRASEAAGAPAPTRSWRSLIRQVRGILVLDAATGLVGGGLSVLTVVVAVDQLNGGPEVTGYLNAATGIGGIVAGVAAGWVVLRRLDVPLVGAAVIAFGAFAVLGATAEVGVALLAIGIAAGALLLLDVLNATIMQRSIPDAERGRASGLMQVAGYTAMSVGALVFPLIAAWIGVGNALALGGATSIALALLAVALLRPGGALGTVRGAAVPSASRRTPDTSEVPSVDSP